MGALATNLPLPVRLHIPQQLLDLGAIFLFDSGEDALLVGRLQLAQEVGSVIILQFLDDVGGLLGVEGRERLFRVYLLGKLREGVCRNLWGPCGPDPGPSRPRLPRRSTAEL